jgi:hypothetical protein
MKAAVEKLVNDKIKAAQSKHGPDSTGETSLIRYTGGAEATDNQNDRSYGRSLGAVHQVSDTKSNSHRPPCSGVPHVKQLPLRVGDRSMYLQLEKQ